MTTEEENRLNEEIELADFQHSIRLQEARQRVCEAAVEWWRANNHKTTLLAEAELADAAGQLAELEEQ